MYQTETGGVSMLEQDEVQDAADAAYTRGVSGEECVWVEPRSGSQIQDHRAYIELVAHELGRAQRAREFQLSKARVSKTFTELVKILFQDTKLMTEFSIYRERSGQPIDL